MLKYFSCDLDLLQSYQIWVGSELNLCPVHTCLWTCGDVIKNAKNSKFMILSHGIKNECVFVHVWHKL